MALDGLWDYLRCEQAVELVSQWLRFHNVTKQIPAPAPILAQASNVIPVGESFNRRNPKSNMAYAGIQAAAEKHFVVIDDNAATHLIRNALGGGNEDLLCGLRTVNLRTRITVVSRNER